MCTLLYAFEGSSKVGKCLFTSSSGLIAEYEYQRRPLHIKIDEKNKQGHRKEEFNVACPPILTKVSSPFYRDETLDYCGRCLLCSFSGKDHVFTTEHKGVGTPSHYRIHKVSLPVSDTFEPVYEIDYQPVVAGEKEGYTQVKNRDGTSIMYHFSKNLLTTSIQYFEQDQLKKEKLFYLG